MRAFIYFLPALLWALLIYSLSTNHPPHLPKFELLAWDKLGHLGFYAIQTLLLLHGAWRSQKQIGTLGIGLMFLLANLYGFSLECVQAYLPHRSFDYADMLANFFGSVLGLLFFKFWQRKTAQQANNS